MNSLGKLARGGWRSWIASLAFGLGLTAVATRTTAAEPGPPHLEAATTLLATVKPADTSYQHKGGQIVWKGEAGADHGECHTDCSGMVDAVVKHAYGLKSAQFKEWFAVARPLAKHYHQAIAEKRGFQNIGQLSQARPGDLLAIQYPAGGENTGHLMLVAEPPRPRAATAPLVAGTKQWEVAVIDVSESGHGDGDTRHRPDGTSGQGIGKGMLRIYTDANDAVAGYSWSTSPHSKFADQATKHLLIGRIDPQYVADLKKGEKPAAAK